MRIVRGALRTVQALTYVAFVLSDLGLGYSLKRGEYREACHYGFLLAVTVACIAWIAVNLETDRRIHEAEPDADALPRRH